MKKNILTAIISVCICLLLIAANVATSKALDVNMNIQPIELESRGVIQSGDVLISSNDFNVFASNELYDYISDSSYKLGVAQGETVETTGYADGYNNGLTDPTVIVDKASVSYKEGVKQGKLNGKVTYSNWSGDLGSYWGEHIDETVEHTWTFNSVYAGKRCNLNASTSFTDTTGGASSYGGSSTQIISIKLNGVDIPVTYSWVIEDGDVITTLVRKKSGPNGAYGNFVVSYILAIIG